MNIQYGAWDKKRNKLYRFSSKEEDIDKLIEQYNSGSASEEDKFIKVHRKIGEWVFDEV